MEQKTMAHWLSRYANMNCGEVLEFLRPTRKHMDQGLIEKDDEFTTTFSTQFLSIRPQFLTALSGRSLTTDEFFKIDKTALAEVLAEEPGFFETPPQDHPAAKAKESVVQDGDEDDINVDELLKGLGIEDKKSSEVEVTKEDMEVVSESETLGLKIEPYVNDLEYLEDQFQLLETKLRIQKVEMNEDEIAMNMKPDLFQKRTEPILRELRAKERAQISRVKNRLSLTLQNRAWLPRLEKLVELRHLDEFEKCTLLTLIGAVISHKVRNAFANLNSSSFTPKSIEVGTILRIYCTSLEQHIHCRTYFHKNSKLVQEGIIKVLEPPFNYTKGGHDLMDCIVEMDRKLLDYLVGLDTQLSELIEGGDLIAPKVSLDKVILPKEQKDLVLNTLSHWSIYIQTRKKMGFEKLVEYGMGLVFLFSGPSGTGKTLTAHAVANFLGKKLLTLNLPALGDAMRSKELLRFVFREAKIHDAIVFFDECEGLFEARGNHPSETGSLLTEIEKYDGLLIMATTRPYDLDEALHRRITLVVEFKSPDFELRQQIWKTIIPSEMPLDVDIDWYRLSMDYELTGGLIKNAVLSALSFAISRDPQHIKVKHIDLDKAAKLQLQGRLQMVGFERRLVPTKGISDLVLPNDILTTLKSIVSFEKARKVLVGQWNMPEGEGTVVLLTGNQGSGKSCIAQALGYELGRPLQEYLCTELLDRMSSKKLEFIFSEAKDHGTILVLHECDMLLGFGRTNAATDATQLLYYVRHYAGILVMTCGVPIEKAVLDFSILGRSPYAIKLGIFSSDVRSKLWAKLIPSKAPLEDKIDYNLLGTKFAFTAGNINNAICRAAEAAALKNTKISMKDLLASAEEEKHRISTQIASFTYYQ